MSKSLTTSLKTETCWLSSKLKKESGESTNGSLHCNRVSSVSLYMELLKMLRHNICCCLAFCWDLTPNKIQFVVQRWPSALCTVHSQSYWWTCDLHSFLSGGNICFWLVYFVQYKKAIKSMSVPPTKKIRLERWLTVSWIRLKMKSKVKTIYRVILLNSNRLYDENKPAQIMGLLCKSLSIRTVDSTRRVIYLQLIFTETCKIYCSSTTLV